MKKLAIAFWGLLVLFGCTTKTEPSREPMRVTLTFDDSLKDHLLIAAPELEKRGWRGTFNIVTDWVGSKSGMMTWDDVRVLVRRGHELATHTVSHPNLRKLLADGNTNEVHRQLAVSRDLIADRTGFVPRFMCAPYVSQDEVTDRICREEGLQQMNVRRHNFGTDNADSIRAVIAESVANGCKRLDLLHHGISAADHGGWEPFPDRASFVRHLDAIAELERQGKIVVTDYDGCVSDCKLKAKAWPRHGVMALSFDDHNLSDWARAFPLFEKYGARVTFFLAGSIGTNEVAFARKVMLAGHGVGLHGVAHRNADQYVAEKGLSDYWDDEIVPQLVAFKAAGIRPRSFAYPNCRRTPETDELFRTNGFTRVRGLCDGIPSPNPHDPKGKKLDKWHPVSESEAEFFPAADYLKVFRIRNVIMGDSYHTDIEDYMRAMRRAGENGEAISVVSHGIAPNANGISMKTEWLERMLSEADEAGVVVRGVR